MKHEKDICKSGGRAVTLSMLAGSVFDGLNIPGYATPPNLPLYGGHAQWVNEAERMGGYVCVSYYVGEKRTWMLAARCDLDRCRASSAHLSELMRDAIHHGIGQIEAMLFGSF